MRIKNHKLPDALLELIENKKQDDLPFISVASVRPLLPPEVQFLGGFFGGMRFFDLDGIKRESFEHLLDIEQMAKLYAIDSSNLRNKPIMDLHILDIDKALFIAGNHDEETIALDYRLDHLNPRVLGSFIPRDWILLAESFSDFLKKLNL